MARSALVNLQGTMVSCSYYNNMNICLVCHSLLPTPPPLNLYYVEFAYYEHSSIMTIFVPPIPSMLNMNKSSFIMNFFVPNKQTSKTNVRLS